MVMNSFITYNIIGNKLSSAGYQSIISNGTLAVADRVDVISGGLPYYYTFTHSESHSIFIMRRTDVTSYMGSRTGRMAVAVAIPKGWRMANAKSPFDLLNDLWAAYRDRYMEWGEFSRSYQFTNVAEDESIFQAIIANYPLEVFSGVVPVTMRGASAAWLQASPSEIRDIMRDTRREGIEQYSEVLLVENGNCSGPQIDIRGHRRPTYSVFCNGMSMGSLIPNGSVAINPHFDAKCYSAPSTTITYDEIERFHLLDMSAGLNVYNSNGVHITVDYIKDRIDCKADLVARELRCQVIISPDSEQAGIEQAIQHHFVFSDFTFMVGRQVKVIEPINNGFVLTAEEICQNISVQWAPGCMYQGGHEIIVSVGEYTGTDNNLYRDITITIHKRHVEQKPYRLTVDVSLKRGRGELYVYINDYKLPNIITPSQNSVTFDLLPAHADILNRGGSFELVVKDYKDKPKFQSAKIEKDNFFNNRHAIYMKPLKRNLKVLWIMVALFIVVGAAGYATYSLLFTEDDKVAPATEETKSEAKLDYYTMDAIKAIIDFYEKEYLSNKEEYTKEKDHIEDGYQVAKLLNGLNADGNKKHSNEGYRNDTKRTNAINALKDADTGRDDLNCIIKILSGDMPVTRNIRDKNFSSDSVEKWVEFCNGVVSDSNEDKSNSTKDSSSSNSATNTYKIEIDGRSYNYDPNNKQSGKEIVDLIKGSKTKFSDIKDLRELSINDDDFKKWCTKVGLIYLLGDYDELIKSIENTQFDFVQLYIDRHFPEYNGKQIKGNISKAKCLEDLFDL